MSGNSVVAMQSLKPGKQIISFEAGISATISHEEVTLQASESSHATGSSHLKTKAIVDYAWDHKYYEGHIVACRGDYLAYAIKGKNGGVVRVVSRGTDDRALLKNMTGAVRDLAFAHTANETLLAVVDEPGNLSVFTVDEDMDKKLVVGPYLSLRRDSEPAAPTVCQRVVWCPYIPDEESEEEADETAKLLLLAHGTRADLLNVSILAEEHGPGPHQMSDLSEGYVEMLEHGHVITDAAFSPDGTALATASADGFVKFFQIYMQDKEGPRMLHEWQPHGGQPLSALLFLDNHRDLDLNEPFWKYAVTGACHNSELKVWTCESWTCLQTLTLLPAPSGPLPGGTPCLQACLDSSAQYLLLSDVHRRMLYVLTLSSADARVRYFCSAREFRLMNPGLSLAILDARRRRIKPFENVEQLESEGVGSDAGGPPSAPGDDADEAQVEGVVIRCYMVQPRSLQECVLVYQTGGGRPGSASAPDAVSSQNGESLECISDHLSDLTLNTTVASVGEAAGRPPDSPLAESAAPAPVLTPTTKPAAFPEQPPAPPPLSLMTPESFTSPSKASPDLVKAASAVGSGGAGSDRSSTPDTLPADFLRTDAVPLPPPPVLPPVEKKRENSCGSSPSIEVQEILNKSGTRHESPVAEPLAPKQQKPFPSPPPPPEPVPEPPAAAAAGAGAASPVAAAVAPAGTAGGQNGWPSVPPVPATPPEVLDSTEPVPTSSAGGGDEKREAASAAALLQSVSGVLGTVRELAVEVQQLRGQLRQLQQQRQPPQPAVTAADLRALLETALTAHQRHIEELLMSRDREERQRVDRQVSALAQSVTSNLKLKVDAAVRQEFKEHVLPLVTSRLKPLEGQIRHEMSARIGDVEALFKETVGKAVSTKGISEAVAQTVAQSLHSTMLARFREAFTTAVPVFEKSTREMMHQLNSSFSAGTKEYLQQVEQQVERWRRGRDPALLQLQQTVDTLRLSVDHAATTAKEERDRQHKHRQEETALLAQVRDEVRRGMAASMEEFQSRLAAAVPAASHPEPRPNPRLQIPQLIHSKQYDEAFQMALSASDLELVVLACEAVEPTELFASSPPCPLSQPVLLALVQQLSADLSRDTELKCRYLEEAVMQIDKEHPAIVEHIHPILMGLQTKLQAFISKPGKHQALVRGMKMLLMAVRSLDA